MSNINSRYWKLTKGVKDSKTYKESESVVDTDHIRIAEIKNEKNALKEESFLYKLAQDFSSRNWEHFIYGDTLVFVTDDSNKEFTFCFRLDPNDNNLSINCQIVKHHDVYQKGDYLEFETKDDMSLINVINEDNEVQSDSSFEETITFNSKYQENNGVVLCHKRKLKLDERHWRYQIAYEINSLLELNDDKQSIN